MWFGIWIIIWFVILGGLGGLTYRRPFWQWIDVVYYPLVAIGVTVFFYEGQVTRDLFFAEARQGFTKAFFSVLEAIDAPNLESLKEQIRSNIEARARRIKELLNQRGQVSSLAFFRATLWPVIILLALSLKFGKAVAGVRSASKVRS